MESPMVSIFSRKRACLGVGHAPAVVPREKTNLDPRGEKRSREEFDRTETPAFAQEEGLLNAE